MAFAKTIPRKQCLIIVTIFCVITVFESRPIVFHRTAKSRMTSPLLLMSLTRGLLAVETMPFVQWLTNLNIKRNFAVDSL